MNRQPATPARSETWDDMRQAPGSLGPRFRPLVTAGRLPTFRRGSETVRRECADTG